MSNQITMFEIETRFGFHKATIEGKDSSNEVHTKLRMNFKSFASYLNENMPAGREAALALTALEEASMWSHKAVAAEDPIQGESNAAVILITVEHLRTQAASDPELNAQLTKWGLG